jgi:hypothetical protein
MIENMMAECFRGMPGKLQVGELALRHAGSQKRLPLSLFGRLEFGK